MEGYARKARAAITYNGKDISASLSPYLKSITVTDNISGQADDLQIVLEDRAGVWRNAWIPDIGATLDVAIICENWPELPGTVYPLGIFEIDEIASSGQPSTVEIKAVSIPFDNCLRGVDRTRSWDKAELKTIANDIATGAGLALEYGGDYNPIIDRAEQTEESDLAFLYKLLKDHGLALKIHANKIVIFAEEEYEAAEPVLSILYPDATNSENDIFLITDVKSYRFRKKLRDIYKDCHLKYQNGKEKTNIEATFADPAKITGKTLEIREQVKSQDEAERIVRKRLREKNCEEVTGTMTLLGNPLLLASNTVTVLGFGAYDGRYIITKANHSIGSGYNTEIEIRRCLNGY